MEEQAILTIARRQPMAIDLRETVGAIRTSGDLERIGDLAKNIAKRVMAMSADPRLPRDVVGVQHMGDVALGSSRTCSTPSQKRDAGGADVWAARRADRRAGIPRCSASSSPT